MTTKEELDILMKEYDAIRNEIDERLKTTQINGLYSLLVVFGGVLAFTATNPNPKYVAFVPPVFIIILGVLVHGWKALEETAHELMRVENKAYLISGRPILTHETEIARYRNRLGASSWVGRWTVTMALYCFLEWDVLKMIFTGLSLSSLIDRIQTVAVLLGPLPFTLYCSKMFLMRRHPVHTGLLDSEVEITRTTEN